MAYKFGDLAINPKSNIMWMHEIQPIVVTWRANGGHLVTKDAEALGKPLAELGVLRNTSIPITPRIMRRDAPPTHANN